METISFEGRLEKNTKMGYSVIYLPIDISNFLKEQQIKRVFCTINTVKLNRAIVSDGSGGSMIILGRLAQSDVKIKEGEVVSIKLEKDPSPNVVELPEEFQEVLYQDPEAEEKFNSFTPGKQRSLAYYVSSAKQIDTRIKRALDLAEKIKTNNLYSQRAKK